MSTSNTPGATQTAAKYDFKPYIFLYGRAEEALGFYGRIFGGTAEIMRVKDAPAEYSGGAPGDLIMHASFTSPIVNFFVADGRETKAVNPDEGNIAVALNVADPAEADRIFKALSEGGKVQMPLSDAFWGGKFGDVVDRFGTEWMVTTH